MISLGPLPLPDDLIWVNEFEPPGISQNILTTLTGATVAQHITGTPPGRTIVLESTDDGDRYYGALTRDEIKELKAIEGDGLPVNLEYHGQNMTVIIRAGGVQFVQLFNRSDPKNDALYTGTLTLLEV